jgi:hypothetical protein
MTVKPDFFFPKNVFIAHPIFPIWAAICAVSGQAAESQR